MFFSNERNNAIIVTFIKKASGVVIEDEKLNTRLRRSLEIIKSINRHPDEWSEKCAFNIKWIGDQFISLLEEFNSDADAYINDIYTCSYRFLCEFDFFIGKDRELGFDISALKSAIQKDARLLDDDVCSNIIYASYQMPANLIKDFLNNEGLTEISAFDRKVTEAKNLKDKWSEELKSKEVEVVQLKDKLEEYKTGFNFVGLYNGFDRLFINKMREKRLSFYSLLALGSAIIMPLLAQLYISLLDSGQSFLATGDLLKLVPLLSIELILLYYFRIVLQNHKSIKTQILQIELRKTLCQFIQSYADYSSTIKKQDSIALEKFENLIFSGILSDSDKLPSTFDGIDQLTALIKSAKSS